MSDRITPTMAVNRLTPGDEIENPSGEGNWVFVGRIDSHPVWPHLCLVIWRNIETGEWSHDALDPRQEVGALVTRHQGEALKALLVGLEARR